MSFYVDNGHSQIDQSQSQNQSHSLREVVVTDDVVISKPKRGRPQKRLNITTKIKPRSSQRLNCK